MKKVAILNSYFAKDISKRHQEILHFIKSKGGQILVSELVQKAKTTTKTIQKLEENGYIIIEDQEVLRLEQGIDDIRDQSKQLSQDQEQALEVINKLQGYGEILLHGVTGSGKTEVYLQAISPLLEQGKSALILVPEIGLTPQLTDRFRARFGDKVFVYHSNLSKGERYDTWRQMLPGEPQVIIGTRSAIFAPLPNLGLIILDEEHDSSFKQTLF